MVRSEYRGQAGMCHVAILFSLFINGLAREIKEKGKGVDVGGRRVRLLMYADDIVLLAESARDLQSMLDVVTSYSKRWRFRLNPKKGKSEVMIFGRNPRNKDRKWWFGEEIGDMYVQVFRDRVEERT